VTSTNRRNYCKDWSARGIGGGHRRDRTEGAEGAAEAILQQGESPVYVKEQLGHSSIQITVNCYGHLIPGGNKPAVDRLDTPIAQSVVEKKSATPRATGQERRVDA